MASKTRKKNGQGTKRSRVRYFFLNDELHKVLSQNRGKDTLTAWNYPRGKVMVYVFSDWLKRQQPAFTTEQVAQMINRSARSLEYAFRDGMIETPQQTYGIDENRNPYQYMWNEELIMDALEYFSTIHYGRPRKDGLIAPKHLPTPRELRAMIHNEEVMYVRRGDHFVPTWRVKE